MLQEAIAKAEGEDGATKELEELEELKQLLPEIREKVEDATESQRTASAASQAIQQALVSSCISRNSQHATSGSGFIASFLCPRRAEPQRHQPSPVKMVALHRRHLQRQSAR